MAFEGKPQNAVSLHSSSKLKDKTIIMENILPFSHISPFANPFYMILKPAGVACNLTCTYCYYKEKENFYPQHEKYLMSEELLEKFIKEYLECQTQYYVPFVWHGG